MPKNYSHSALESFRNCPRQFKFQYVDKVKVPKLVTPDAYLGASVHLVLKKLYRLASDGIVLPKEEVTKLYREEWEKIDVKAITVVADYHTVDDYIRLGEEMLMRHYDHYHPFRPGQLIGTELSITFELPETPFKFRAIVDRIVRREDGTVEIADYKTGKHMVQPQDAKFRSQMGLYHLAVKDRYPQFEDIEVSQYFLRLNEVVRYRMTPDDIEILTENIRGEVLGSLNATRLDDFPTKESGLCDYCKYFRVCPAKLHKLRLEEAADDGEVSPEKTAADLAERYLSVSSELNERKALQDALKEQIIKLARETGWTSLEGKGGTVQVSLAEREKFVTKTDDKEAFAELSFLAREYGLDDYFKLEGPALMKEIYAKQRLSPEQMEKLSKYVMRVDSSRVRAKYREEEPDEQGEGDD